MWLSKWKGVEGAASSFAAEFAREIVHGRSFRALGFCQAHGKRARGFLENGGRVAGVADDGSEVWLMMARRRADAGKHYGEWHRFSKSWYPIFLQLLSSAKRYEHLAGFVQRLTCGANYNGQ